MSDSNRVGLRYRLETNWGEDAPTAPAVAFTQIRHVGESLGYNKNSITSDELRTDRQTTDFIEVGVDVNGGINFDLSAKNFEDFMLAALCATAWTTIDLSALTLTVTKSTRKIQRSAGSWVTDGVKVGNFLLFGGFTAGAVANNDAFRVTAITQTTNPNDTLTLEDPGGILVDAAAAPACTAKTKYARNGVTARSFGIEKEFADKTLFWYFNGMRLSDMSFQLATKAIAKGSMAFIGKKGIPSALTVALSETAAQATQILSASAHVGNIVKDGALITAGLRSLNFSYKNNLRAQDQIGSKFNSGVAYGAFVSDGNFEVYLEDNTFQLAVVNSTPFSLWVPFKDQATPANRIIFSWPSIKAGKGMPNAPGANQDVMLPVEWSAIMDATLGYTAEIDIL